METSFHYLIMANQALFQKRLLDRLRGTGLTLGQPKVLDYLGNHDGASQKEIAGACHIEAGSLTVLLGRMEGQGMVRRESPPGDRRTLQVFLTSDGWRLQRKVSQAMEELEQEFLAPLDSAQRELLCQALHTVHQQQLNQERK